MLMSYGGLLLHRRNSKRCIYELENTTLVDGGIVLENVRYEYLFPYHLFPENSKVVICGANDIGEEFCKQIEKEEYVFLAGWVDVDEKHRKRRSKETSRMFKPSPLTALKNCEYDYILIAFSDAEKAQATKSKLLKKGISEDKIKWDGAVYEKDDFFKKMYLPILRNWNEPCFASEEWLRTFAIKMERSVYDHVFPYHLFPEHAKVLIYGAGDIGRKYYRQAMADGYVEVVGILDKSPQKAKEAGIPAEGIEALCSMGAEADYILISIHQESIANQVKNMLMQKGIAEKKIKWDGITYFRDEFVQNVYLQLLRKLGNGFASSRDMLLSSGNESKLDIYDHVFPYHLFHRDERIAIYGAGDVGKKFYRQVKHHGYVQIVAIVDKNAINIHEPDIPVGKVETLKQFNFESVLISMTSAQMAREAKDILRNLGIAEERIKWVGGNYYREHFYRNYLFKQLGFLAGLRESKL